MGFRDLIAIRCTTRDGSTMWRGVPDLEHSTLCRAFGLDPIRTVFDLPSTARGTGSSQVGAGSSSSGRRLIHGFALWGGEPIARLTWAFDGEKFRDEDPTDPKDWLFR
jgi:hypothetical protein